jgi:hypothetical protein
MSMITMVFIGEKLEATQKPFYSTQKASLEADNLKILFSSDLEANPDVAELVTGAKEGSFFLFDESLIQLEKRNSIDSNINWVDVFKQFVSNFLDSEPDVDGMYCWGQKAPQTAEYLCKDCGYILELQKGEIFPVCEVCLSGEPDGPSGVDQGYWEML